MPDPSYPEWRGWHRPRYTPVPDQLFDEWLAPGRLSSVELRVLLYILRHTFGWHKDVDAISLTQITDGITRRDGTRQDWGAGVSRQSAITAIKGLEDKRLIVTHKQKSADRGFETNSYGLLMAPEGWSNNLTSPVQSLDSALVQPLDSQETPNPTNKNGWRPLNENEQAVVAAAVRRMARDKNDPAGDYVGEAIATCNIGRLTPMEFIRLFQTYQQGKGAVLDALIAVNQAIEYRDKYGALPES